MFCSLCCQWGLHRENSVTLISIHNALEPLQHVCVYEACTHHLRVSVDGVIYRVASFHLMVVEMSEIYKAIK